MNSRQNRSPVRKESRLRDEDRNESRLSHDQKSVPQRFSSRDRAEKDHESTHKHYISDSTIKKISQKANRLVEILENEPDPHLLEEAKYRMARQPLSRKDENVSRSEIGYKGYEDHGFPNKKETISKTLQAVEIPLYSEESERDIYGSQGQPLTSLGENKENSRSSDLRTLRSRLQNLQNNKNVLEQKMQEFEKKINGGTRS